ncbi:MAG: hypothetical protein LBQ14_05080 [Treponema sp.]|jgi:hypothetical protein|nr:hypothetical protein [Treponema sp.]
MMIQTAEPEVQTPVKLQSISAEKDEFNDEEFHSGKIYCANCGHCKLIPAKPDGLEAYLLRVRCTAGKWKKKLGEEKMYKYCTITRRYLDQCDAYEEMGDTREFIRDLRKSLPSKDEPYFLTPGRQD